jgi:outer membrane protein TolC
VQLETQEASLQRQLATLNRTVEEMELRYQLGQISALQLEQTKAGRTSLVSVLETVQMNVYNLKIQLEMMIGADLTGEISLGPVPEVTEEQLADMDRGGGPCRRRGRQL